MSVWHEWTYADRAALAELLGDVASLGTITDCEWSVHRLDIAHRAEQLLAKWKGQDVATKGALGQATHQATFPPPRPDQGTLPPPRPDESALYRAVMDE